MRGLTTACLRILHIAAPAPVGGLESVVRSLAAGQLEAGHDVHVAAVVSQPQPSDPFLSGVRESAVTLHVIEVSGRAYLRERAAVAHLCKELRPHVVHTHGYRSDVIDAGAAREVGFPTVSTVHGFTRAGFRGKVYEWAQVRSYRRFDAVVAVSRQQVDEIVRAGVDPAKIHVIQNAWTGSQNPIPADQARRELGIPGGRLHVGWAGRLTHEKGPDIFVDAMLQLTDLPAEISVIGDGPYLEPLRRRTAKAGMADRFHWHGVVKDAGSLFPAFDVLVMSSRTEGTPIVLLEAMAARVPIVAAAVGGIPDVVSPHEAELVPPLDSEALATAIRATLLQPAHARARADAAAERLNSHFGKERWLNAYDNVYHRVVERAQRRKSV